MVEALATPRGPYSLALSARLAGDATRTFRDGAFLATLDVAGRVERAGARQGPDGRVRLVAESPGGLELLRFVLALDDDHSPFLRLAAADPLLGVAARRLAGLRPLRLGTVAHALLRALCGQQIEARWARAIERRIVRASSPARAGRHAPPTGPALAAFSPAQLRALGLHARRSAALVRLCSTIDLEALRAVPTEAVAARLERERGIGPWSVGVICLQGLGRSERGLVGDLGLVKLLSALRGRWVEGWETAELLEPYGEWAGLASVYLLAAFGKGLVPVPAAA
jgi:3-methyladenine DNA glycosylase/8-oxoguanine DNA glycosylase